MIGRVVKGFANSRAGAVGLTGAAGGAFAIGAGSAILQKDGPYADIQEQMTGSPNFLRAAISAEISTTARRNTIEREDNKGYLSNYYGRPVNPRSDNFPVDGQMVFSLWNGRR